MLENTNLIGIFLTGLIAGGLSCLAVQGGLLAATIAQREEEKLKEKSQKSGLALPLVSFLLAKLAAYTLVGFLLGSLGQAATVSSRLQVGLQFAVVIFMVGTALAMLNVHPVFRYFIIQPPKFLTRRVRNVSKSGDMFAPALLGVLTVFIPCGITQAAMVTAVATASPWAGAAVLFAFTLGTSPLFFILGFAAAKMGERLHKKFLKVAATAILLLALYNLNNALALAGSKFTPGGVIKSAVCGIAFCGQSEPGAGNAEPAVSEATIQIVKQGYSPSSLTVKAGSRVTLHLENKDTFGCQLAFTIPKLNVRKIIKPGSSETVEFTAPLTKGPVLFMCSMGMYRGVIQVI